MTVPQLSESARLAQLEQRVQAEEVQAQNLRAALSHTFYGGRLLRSHRSEPQTPLFHSCTASRCGHHHNPPDDQSPGHP
jgi:hypothetical protein